MSTDKTLADVQPGGRVRIGDQAERARFEAWAGENYHLQRMGDVYRSAITTDAWRAWQAALSAQPSPGGQGDALRSFACEAVEYFRNRSDVVDGDYGSPSPNEEMKLMSEGEAALAARQPVGEPVAYLDLGAGGYMDVGTDLSDEELAVLPKGRHMLGIIGTYGVDGYKPAQAVDLEQLPDGWRLSKKATCYQLSHGNDIIGNLVGPDAEENAAIIARVLDSQAEGK